MKTLIVKNLIAGSYSSSDGFSLFCILEPDFIHSNRIEVSLKDFPPMSSSFFNSSFGELIDKYGIQKFRETVKFSNLTNSQAQLLRKYIEFHLH